MNEIMKRTGILAVMPLLLLTGCQHTETGTSQRNEICGFLKSIDETGVVIDEAEYITPENSRRIRELNLTEEDLLSGYYIYNPEKETKEYRLTSDTVYNFIDWGRDFTDSDDPVEVSISTTDVSEFIKYINTYTDAQPGMPFFFETDGESIISITEKPMA